MATPEIESKIRDEVKTNLGQNEILQTSAFDSIVFSFLKGLHERVFEIGNDLNAERVTKRFGSLLSLPTVVSI